ncbi:MAG: hypothetical protein ACFCD0_26450 [Gemmataceae bacterium]
MPVLTCPTCDVRLEIPDEFLGRQVKCSECATILDASNAEPTRPSSQRAGRGEDEVAFRERGESRPRYQDDVRVARRSPGNERLDSNGEKSAAASKRKKPKGRSVALIVGLIGTACLLVVVGIVIGFWSGSVHEKQEDMAYIPDQTAMVCRLRLKDFNHLPNDKNLDDVLQQAVAQDRNARDLAKFAQAFDQHLENIDEIFFAYAPQSPNTIPGVGMTVIVHTNKDFTIDEVVDVLEKMDLEEIRNQRLQGKDVRHLVPTDIADQRKRDWLGRNRDDAYGACLLDERTILIGDIKTMRDSLKGDYEPEMASGLQEVFDAKELKKRSLYFAADFLALGPPPKSPNSGFLYVDITKKKLSAAAEFRFRSAQAANALHREYRTLRGPVDGLLLFAPKSIRSVVNGLKVEVDGQKLKGTYDVEIEDLERAMIDAQQFANRPDLLRGLQPKLR